MAIKKQAQNGPVPKKGRTDSAGMQYFGKQVAAAMNSQKPSATASSKKTTAAPKKATTTAVAAKKPSTINKRAPLMEVDLGKKGNRISIDTTNMNKPDEKTYNYMVKDSTGKVTSKGNLSRAGGGAGVGKYEARKIVNKLKAKK